MVIGDATSEKFFGLNATADMMTLDGPACDERFYLDNWKPAASSPAPSASSSVSSDTPSADVESTWRRTSSSGESYDGSCHNMTWRPPTSSHTPTDYSQQQYGSMCNYPSPSSDSGASWKEKAVEQWSADDVTLWICSLMNNQSQVHFQQSVNVAPYLNMRGMDLLQMSSADIQARDPESGMFVFMSLQHHMTTVSVGSPHSYDQRSSPVHSPYSPPQHNVDNSPTAHRSPPIKREPVIMDTFSSKLTSIDFNQLPSFDASVTFSGIKSIGQEQVTVSDMEAWQMKKPQPPPQPASGQQQTGGHNFVFPQPHPMFPPPSMWSTNWMPMLPSPNDSFYPPGAGGNHLWEFIRDLLFDSRYNPALIKWEDREEGVFKFVKSDQVAKLWGKKKNNSAMTYEKLSRAMRYYYRRKILERIDGRRLVYKFGPMATGWKA